MAYRNNESCSIIEGDDVGAFELLMVEGLESTANSCFGGVRNVGTLEMRTLQEHQTRP
jgi:hypothetical protein